MTGFAAGNVVTGHHLGLYRTLAGEYPNSRFTGSDYHDLAATIDCLHDMGDPLAAARHIRQALKPDRTWLVVEPYAADEVAGNLNPVGRVYYSAPTQLCAPNELAQPGGYALGAQASEAAIRQVTANAGSTRFCAPPRRRSTWSTRVRP